MKLRITTLILLLFSVLTLSAQSKETIKGKQYYPNLSITSTVDTLFTLAADNEKTGIKYTDFFNKLLIDLQNAGLGAGGGIDWTLASQGVIHASNYVESDPTFTTWQPIYDAHAANGGIHYLQSTISILESQISNLSHTVDTKNPLSDNISTVSSTTSASSTAVKSVNDKVNTNISDITNKEDALGNPITNGYVLSSQTDGTRSWVVNGAGSADGSETKINAGINITLTGTGTIADPYVVNSTGSSTTVIDNLNSTSGTDALSAGQGKVLDDKITAVTAGTGNPLIFVPTVQADLSNVANAGKIADMQSIISMTSNLALADGITLKNSGGYIILNGFTLTGSNTTLEVTNSNIIIDSFDGIIDGSWNTPVMVYADNFGTRNEGLKLDDGNITIGTNIVTSATANFTASDIGKVIAIIGAGGTPDAGEVQGYVLTSTISSITNSTTVVIADNAITTAINQPFVYVWNDDNAIFNANYVRNQKSGNLYFTEQDYWHSTRQTETQWTQDPTGWILGNGTDNIHWVGNGASLKLIPNDLDRSRLIRPYKTINSSVKYFKAYGDYTYYSAENGKTEGTHFIQPTSNAINFSFQYNYVEGYFGDGYESGGDSQFMNAIKGTAASNYAGRATDVLVGNIDASGVIDGADTDFIYTETMLPLTGFQFDKAKEFNNGRRFYMMTGSSFAGWGGLTQPYFWAVYYDSGGTFISKSEKLDHYERIPINDENIAFARIVYPSVRDITLVDLQVRPDISPTGGDISFNEIAYCGRNGISNAPKGSRLIGNIIHNIGGLAAGPGAAWDEEDGSQLNRNIIAEGNIFYDNWADITLIGAENIIIRNNFFLRNSEDQNLNGAPTQVYQPAISSFWGRNVIAEGNLIYHKSVILDRSDLFQGNKMRGGSITYSANDNKVKNNEFLNVRLDYLYRADTDRIGYATVFEDNDFDYNQLLTSSGHSWFRDNDNATIFKNNNFRFNSIAQWSSLATQSDAVLESGVANNVLFIKLNQNFDFGGYWEGNTFSGILPSLATRDTAFGTASFPLTNYNGDVIEHPIIFQTGLPQDYTMSFKTHWVYWQLGQFEDTVISTTPIITVPDSEFIIDDTYNWTGSNAHLIITPAKNVAFEFYNSTFAIDKASGVTSLTDRYFNFNHLGTTLLDNCTFRSVTPKVINFTDTNKFPANLGAITIINPTLDGISFILRAGDRIIYYDDNSISKLEEKVTPTGSDWIYVEDVADGGKIKKTAFPVSAGGGLSNIVEDLTPQLGGNLDPNGNDIDFFNDDINIGDVGANNNTTVLRVNDITGVIEMTAASVTKNGSEVVDRAYGDANYLGSGILNIVEDLTPQLGATLDAQGFNIDSIQDMTFKNALNTIKFNGGLPLIKHVELSANGSLGRFTFSKFNDGGSGGTIMTIEEDVVFPSAAYNNDFLQSNMFVTKDWINKNDFIANMLEVTTTTYTLLGELFASYAGISKTIEFNNASDITVTVPLNATDVMDIGTRVVMIQKGVGQIIVVPEGAVIINTSETLKSKKQRSKIILIKTAIDEWTLFGDLEELIPSGSLPVDDGTAVVKGSVDATKFVRIEADNLATATTRVITMPDRDIDLDNVGIMDKTTVTASTLDFVQVADASDSNNLKKVLVSDLTGAASPILTANLTITNPVISGGVTTVEIVAAQGANKVIMIHGYNAVGVTFSAATGNTSVQLRYGGDGASYAANIIAAAAGGNYTVTGGGSFGRPITGDNVALNAVLTNTTDQTLTGTVYIQVRYSIVDRTTGF